MTTLTTAIPRSITFDRTTKDFRAEADENVIGYFPSYLKAEEAINDYVADLLERGLIGSPDAGSFCPSCGDALVGDDAVCAACREASEAPASCYVCDAAAWQHDHLGPLCPSHFAAVEEPASVGLSLDIEQPRELFYQLWHDQSYTTKAPPGATFTAEVCAACQDLLSHVPFSKPGSYRLFAYCERCNKAVEL